MGYRQIAKIKNTPISMIAGVVQRYRKRGHVADAPRQGRPTKITGEVQQRVADTVEANPRASLQQITDTLADLNIGHTTVDKVLKQLGFKLRIPRKKPLLDVMQKVRRKFWCRRRLHWSSQRWRRSVWLDEARVEYSTYQPGRKVRIRPGEELLEKNLAPTFRSGRITVNCWAAVTYGWRTPLIRVRKRLPSERKTKRDRLGLDGTQYANEIYEEYLIPFLFSLDKPLSQLRVVEDNAPYHKGGLNKTITSSYGVQKLQFPANSRNLNPIENVWHIFKQRLRKRFSENELARPHTEDELWEAMREEWDAIPQSTIDRLVDRMPHRIVAVVDSNGSHIKW